MDWFRKKPWLVLLVHTIVLVQVFGNVNGCSPEEKRSLLEFKAAYCNETLLPSWVDHPNSDCCHWEGVTCDPSSSHVFNLSLQNLGKRDINGDCLSQHLNWSLFLGFTELTSLGLSHNCFQNLVFEEGSIYGMESLVFLLLAGNRLQDELSSQICQLKSLQVLDLSRNNITGSVPSCLNNIAFRDINFIESHRIETSVSYGQARRYIAPMFRLKFRMGEVQFITKGSFFSYEGSLLKAMSALDLSSNQLTGEIPRELGDLRSLRALNLSHNRLNGSIPENFHNLQNIESLDLSNNSLSGQIPLDLQDLYSLAIFNVSYNNLSGIAPGGNQFATFDDSNYEGNPFLHWTNRNKPVPPSPIPLDEGKKKDDSFIDLASFYWTFSASYVTVLLALVTILWINPYWRSQWFYFVVWCLVRCFGQFLGDAFCKKIMK